MKEYTFSEKIMGTELDVSIIAENERTAEEGYQEVLILAKRYERKFSRFLEDSELSVLNKQKDKIVSKEFLSVIKIAKEMNRQTNGIFNPLLQVERVGYDKSFEKIKDRTNINTSTEEIDTNIDNLTIKESDSRVILQAGQKLDFGGFLKGYVAETICKKLSERFSGVIVNLGGDLFTTGLDENQKEFIFVVENPISKNLSIEIPLQDKAMATSGNYKRKWKIGEDTISHIIDESGKNPKTELVSATIISPHGHLSEAFATSALCLSKDASEKFLKEKDVSYLLITNSGEILTNINI